MAWTGEIGAIGAIGSVMNGSVAGKVDKFSTAGAIVPNPTKFAP